MRVAIARGSPGPAVRLFSGPLYGLGGRGDFASLSRTYDVSLDGRRFVMIKSADVLSMNVTPERIVVVQNWFEELERKLPRR